MVEAGAPLGSVTSPAKGFCLSSAPGMKSFCSADFKANSMYVCMYIYIGDISIFISSESKQAKRASFLLLYPYIGCQQVWPKLKVDLPTLKDLD